MEKIELAAARRSVEKSAAKRLRTEGQVPGILYGHAIENVPIQIETLELKRILAQAGASQLIHLQIDAASTTHPVLAREIQRDVLTGEPTHVDFLAVSMSEKISAMVTIFLVGEPAAVTAREGMLLQGANTIEIECLPGDLIPALEVDISDLEIDSALYIGDLNLPDAITVLSDPQEMVAQIAYESLEEEEEEEEELMMEEAAEVEVLSRGRAEEEED